MKLKSITLRNFKQFEKITIPCRDTNVLVGPNNAGKSTALDALRIGADVIRIMSRRKPVNQSHDGFGVCPSYHIEHTSLSVGTTNIVRDYGDEDAMITLMHETAPR